MVGLTKEEIKALPIARVIHGELKGRDYYANPSPWLSYELYDLTKAEYVAKVDGQYIEIQPEIIWELVHERAQIPTYNPDDLGSAGMDLYTPAEVVIPARGKANVKLGIKYQCPPGHYLKIEARSGTAWKNGIEVGAGVLDWSYGGEVGVVLYNHLDEQFTFSVGDRVAQAILLEYKRARNVLGTTTNTRDGFGSSGK